MGHIPGVFEGIEWPTGDGTDAMVYTFNLLTGKTEKGDTVSFHRVHNTNMDLFAGFLRNKEGKLKILVPLLLAKEEGTTLTEYFYYGEVVESDIGYNPRRNVISTNCDIDKEVWKQFLAG